MGGQLDIFLPIRLWPYASVLKLLPIFIGLQQSNDCVVYHGFISSSGQRLRATCASLCIFQMPSTAKAMISTIVRSNRSKVAMVMVGYTLARFRPDTGQASMSAAPARFLVPFHDQFVFLGKSSGTGPDK